MFSHLNRILACNRQRDVYLKTA